MKYVSFIRPEGIASFGRLEGDQISDLGAQDKPARLKDALANLADLEEQARFALTEVTLLPPIPDPAKILCIGLNFANHIAETGRATDKEHPAVFTRWSDTLVAHGAPLVRPPESTRFDYEGELAVIIGKGGRRIARENAAEHIAGYSIFNDASVRDWQRHNIQFTPGKNFPGTGAFGPALIPASEISDLGAMRVQTKLNGQLVQDQPISDMIWDVADIIAYCSTFTELEPGDVIAAGTPGGVGDKRNPPLYMKAGDRVEVSIGSLGTLANPVADEAVLPRT